IEHVERRGGVGFANACNAAVAQYGELHDAFGGQNQVPNVSDRRIRVIQNLRADQAAGFANLVEVATVPSRRGRLLSCQGGGSEGKRDAAREPQGFNGVEHDLLQSKCLMCKSGARSNPADPNRMQYLDRWLAKTSRRCARKAAAGRSVSCRKLSRVQLLE